MDLSLELKQLSVQGGSALCRAGSDDQT
jgi:hypothetical protein